MTKTLYLLRHAKALPATGQQEDHERALAERGKREAEEMGVKTKNKGLIAAHIISSGSQRTRETLELFGASAPVEFTDKLYLASPNEILSVIHSAPESDSLMIVGHNPGLQMFCQQMVTKGDEAALDELNEHFPTCSFAVITLPDASWKSVRFGQGSLRELLLAGPR